MIPISVPNLPEHGGRTNPSSSTSIGPSPAIARASRPASTPPRCPNEERQNARREVRHRRASRAVLLADNGAGRRHRRAERRQHAERTADPGQLRPAERPGRPERTAGPRVDLLRHGQSPRPVLLQRPDLMVAGAVRPPRHGPGQRGPGPRPTSTRSGLPRPVRASGSGLAPEILDLSQPPNYPPRPRPRRLAADGPRRGAGSTPRSHGHPRWTERRARDWYADKAGSAGTGAEPGRQDGSTPPATLARLCSGRPWPSAKPEPDHRRRSPAAPADKNRPAAAPGGGVADRPADRGEQPRAGRLLLSYRYFASEGFLPGYNFPRLPLSAYIRARGAASPATSSSRAPRFLAITESGPRSIIYHEGSRYQINRVILPVADGEEPSPSRPSSVPRAATSRPAPGDGWSMTAARLRASDSPAPCSGSRTCRQTPRSDQLRRRGTDPNGLSDPLRRAVQERGRTPRAARPPSRRMVWPSQADLWPGRDHLADKPRLAETEQKEPLRVRARPRAWLLGRRPGSRGGRARIP